MRGPFMRFPFMDDGETLGATRMVAIAQASAQFIASSAWDATLTEDNSPIAYFAIIEPHVLADRS
jgi:hypothetical protein